MKKQVHTLADHYFTQQPQSKSSPKTWKYRLREKEFLFTSDVGVFSKNEVDYGSKLLIEKYIEPKIDGDILDLGCGYGPIGLSIAKSFVHRKIVMVDVNDRAVQLARTNAKNNQVNNVQILQSDGFSEISSQHFASIVTNPPIRAGKQIIYSWFEKSSDALIKGGELWIVIQKKQGAPSARKKLEDLFDNVEVVARDKGYYVLRAFKV